MNINYTEQLKKAIGAEIKAGRKENTHRTNGHIMIAQWHYGASVQIQNY